MPDYLSISITTAKYAEHNKICRYDTIRYDIAAPLGLSEKVEMKSILLRRRFFPKGNPARGASGLLVTGLTVAAVALAVQQILPLLQRNSVDAAPTKNGEKITDTTNRKQGKHSSENHDKGPTSNRFSLSAFMLLPIL